MGELFGTDGIRGEVNHAPLKPELLLKIGRALGEFWQQHEDAPAVIIGHDGRLSGDYVQNLLSGALQGSGLRVKKIGLTSTPALAAVTSREKTAGGIMISASHNPYYDNGIKPFQASGEKFTDSQEQEVEKIINNNSGRLAYREKIGVSEAQTDVLQNYIDSLAEKLPPKFNRSILVDCAHGGSSRLVPALFASTGVEATVINNNPDGVNINREAGSLHVETLKQEKKRLDADLAFALDGDGDRLLAVDEDNKIVDGDTLLYILGLALQKKQLLDGGVVLTVMSNLGLRRTLEEKEIQYSVVGVGDKKVYRELLARDWYLGGEQSGHIINRHHLPTGDGLYTLVSVLTVLAEEEKKLAEFNGEVPEYPQVLHNVEVDAKPPLDSLEMTTKKIEKVEDELGEEGRVLVRYSGTEPVARVMLEGKNEQQLQELAEEIGKQMVEEINDNWQ